MNKYRHFPLFLGVAGILLLLFFFPVSFDNNDDQIMYFISSGILSGHPSPYLLLTNLGIGKLLNTAFSFFPAFNWYTAYLECALAFSLIAIFFAFTSTAKISTAESVIAVLVILAGFAALCIVKLQFTTVALFCCFAALLLYQSHVTYCKKLAVCVSLISLSILIRKESFYLFLLFCLPVYFVRMEKRHWLRFSAFIAYAAAFFFISVSLNNHSAVYKKQRTYAYLQALDAIAAKPIHVTDEVLNRYHFSQDDLTLLANWFPAGSAYRTGDAIIGFAREVETVREPFGIFLQLKKLNTDERYALAMYLFSFLLLLLFARSALLSAGLNLGIAMLFVLYLSAMSRIPHRLIFPILCYCTLLNLYCFLRDTFHRKTRMAVLSLLLAVSAYKFFCVTKMIGLNRQAHARFDEMQAEIQKHPGKLFIGVYDGYPVEYMNAWKSPSEFSSRHNLIPSAWYAYSPDYNTLLHAKQLANLMSALRNRKNVYFLTASKEIERAYANVLLQRYRLSCHFEETKEFKTLQAGKLVFSQ
jgi:hypothetical protein